MGKIILCSILPLLFPLYFPLLFLSPSYIIYMKIIKFIIYNIIKNSLLMSTEFTPEEQRKLSLIFELIRKLNIKNFKILANKHKTVVNFCSLYKRTNPVEQEKLCNE